MNAQEFKTRAEALAGMSRKDSHEVHALVSHLIEDGMTKTDAIHAVAEEIDSSAQSVSAAYYRRQRAANGWDDAVADLGPATKTLATKDELQRTREVLSAKRWHAFEALINEIVEERVAERLEAARKALG